MMKKGKLYSLFTSSSDEDSAAIEVADTVLIEQSSLNANTENARIKQFQVIDAVLYVLDEDGTLWRNMHPPTSGGWHTVPGPTRRQHAIENEADSDREKRWDISK